MTQWANQGPVKLQRWATSSASFEAASAKTALTTTQTRKHQHQLFSMFIIWLNQPVQSSKASREIAEAALLTYYRPFMTPNKQSRSTYRQKTAQKDAENNCSVCILLAVDVCNLLNCTKVSLFTF